MTAEIKSFYTEFLLYSAYGSHFIITIKISMRKKIASYLRFGFSNLNQVEVITIQLHFLEAD
jgi:hypothetical protein